MKFLNFIFDKIFEFYEPGPEDIIVFTENLLRVVFLEKIDFDCQKILSFLEDLERDISG